MRRVYGGTPRRIGGAAHCTATAHNACREVGSEAVLARGVANGSPRRARCTVPGHGDTDEDDGHPGHDAGPGVVPRMGQGGRHPGVAIRRLRNPEPARAIYAVVREPSPAPAALRGLLDALRAAAAEITGADPRQGR